MKGRVALCIGPRKFAWLTARMAHKSECFWGVDRGSTSDPHPVMWVTSETQNGGHGAARCLRCQIRIIQAIGGIGFQLKENPLNPRSAAMGMFDYLKCEMPLPPECPKEPEWQTKSLDRSMAWYAIRSDGTLVDRHIRREQKPGAPEQPEFLTEEYFAWSQEWWEPKEGPDEPVNYTGEIRFYAMDKPTKQWWEFCAFIEGGKCFKIVQIEPSPESV